jgi:tRNA pseudouridine55 synthase
LVRVAAKGSRPGRTRGEPLHGVLIVDKPRGPTSHDVVMKLRRLLLTREIGHAGTLDPMATGVLVVGIGEGTKLAPYLTSVDKTYEATIELGATTDTLDAEGKVTKRIPVNDEACAALMHPREPLPRLIEAALMAESTRTEQVPPQYSAIHEKGERAHTRARRGEKVQLPLRPVVVHKLVMLGAGIDPKPWLALRVEVSKGYFVRALARDLAERLGTVGYLTSLRRTRSGPFTLDEASPLDTPDDELIARIMPLGRAAGRALHVARLTEQGARDARFGRRVRAEDLDARASGPHAWLDGGDTLVAVGERLADGSGRVLRGFQSKARPRRGEGGG